MPVVTLLTQQAQAKPVGVPRLRLDGDRLRSGEELRGSIDPGEARSVALVLVERDGSLRDLGAPSEEGRSADEFCRPHRGITDEPWEVAARRRHRQPRTDSGYGTWRGVRQFRALRQPRSKDGPPRHRDWACGSADQSRKLSHGCGNRPELTEESCIDK